MTNPKTFTINGKESVLEIVGKRNDTEVYIFLHTPRKWRCDLIYGLSYDLVKREIVGCDKFADIGEGSWRTADGSGYTRFRSKWGLNKRDVDTFYVSSGGYGPGSGHDARHIGTSWDFKDVNTLKTAERIDLEAIVEQLRTSHMDFSRQLSMSMYTYPTEESEWVEEDPELIVKRNLESVKKSLKSARRESKTLYFEAEHPMVESISTFHHSSKVIVRTTSYYKYSHIRSTLEFEGGKTIDHYQPEPGYNALICLADPVKGGACFLNGSIVTRFLDDRGNEIGEKVGFPERLERLEGIFKDSSGTEIPYRYKLDYGDHTLLDYKGDKVAIIDKTGFLKEILPKTEPSNGGNQELVKEK